jgi:SWI/SNF-related matrix-associated actin-dependent regulator 1 of chromatin subfamily A
MNEATFRDRFNPGGRDRETGAVWEYVSRLPELNARLRCNFMVRRLKEDVLKDLPAKRYELVYAETTGQIAMALHAERMLDLDEETLLARSGGKIDGAISTVRREMGEAMAPFASEHCDTLLTGGTDKLVVFAHHHSVLDHLQKQLTRHGVIRVDGNTTGKGKGIAVEQFKFDPRKKVFLGQLTSVGTGTDGLQEVCQQAVFAEASWVFGENEQGVDRLHRIGQNGSVHAQFLVAEGSISERIIGRSIAKGRITSEVLDAAPI